MKKPLLCLFAFIFIANHLLAQPNNTCASAALITTDSACVTGTSRLINQTLTGASADGYTITSSCGMLTNARDVWYRFIARTKYPTITVSNPGTGWGGIANVNIQLLSGTCGVATFTEVACASGASLTPSLTNPLVEGNTYYIRIHRNSTGAVPVNYTFDICVTDALTKGSRMNEVFSRTILSPASVLNYPWEVTYGPDNNLWVTESKGYKVYKIDPATGAKTTVLDISQGSTFFTAPADVAFNCQFANGAGAQGGLAGLALHPNFLNGLPSEKNYVYISYIRSSASASFFTNRVARFTYNAGTNRLESPVSLCDTLPGSNDHNSQRMFIAPVTPGGTKYLFYASGDMGAGQGNATNRARTIKSQFTNSYEGKILRFNLESDGDAGLSAWVPNDNPYNTMLGVQSAVWNIGIRNNQGFAYDTALNILYGSSHGPYSDDELNILEGFKNYGHPLVIGYVADGNYDGNTNPGSGSNNLNISAGAPYSNPAADFGNSSCPPIGSEATRRSQIDASGNGLYKDPLFSAYPETAAGPGSVRNLWQTTTGANAAWPSEGWSGLDLYTNKIIPGWKKSLVVGGLKWGRLVKLKLGPTGTTILPYDGKDTVTYFQSVNRYRDIAFAPNGKDIYIIMDNNAATSGPGIGNPIVPACPGCLLKYTFLGYADAGGKSSISPFIPVTNGTVNTCNTGTTITIDATNNNLWVPITGPDGNIMAEIHANGNNLGTVTSSFYKHAGPIRVRNGSRYLNRNITITPQNQPGSAVKIRLYFSRQEYNLLDADALSGVNAITNVKILKNNDACGGAVAANTTLVTPDFYEAHDTTGYMLQGSITAFSSFYFGSSSITLPLELLTFSGSLQNNATLLKWETANETNTSHFEVERSIDNSNFVAIGTVAAAGNSTINIRYSYTDNDVANLSNIIYYRLKMVDADGKYIYSNTISVTLPLIAGKVSIYPNPATHEVRLTVASAAEGNAQWKIIDNAGRVVLQSSMHLKKGNNNVMIDINRLSGGLYYLSVYGPGIDQKLKLQKL